MPARPSLRVESPRSLEKALLAFPRRLHSGGGRGQTDDGPLPRESVGLFRPMNLGVSGESGLASKQIRGKISVGRRRRKDGTKRDGRQTDGLSFGKDLRRNHRCAKPFRPSSRFHTGNERRRDCESGRDGREAALTDSVADRLRRLVTEEDSKSAILGRRFGTDGRSELSSV